MRFSPCVVGVALAVGLLWAAGVPGCGGHDGLGPASPTPVAPIDEATAPVDAAAQDEVLVGAGDIAQCGVGNPEATAALLDRIPGTVFTLGDNVQGRGTIEDYERCFGPTWGRHRWRMFPTIGNHDVDGTGGAPYFTYFGNRAGPAGLGYYSYTLGAWHVVSLNSEIDAGIGSPQYEWLEADLSAAGSACVVAMWHRPLFSSGPSGGSGRMRDAWRLLQRLGADVVLSGHDHDYERFAPQDASGHASPDGLRAFVIGTGGYVLYPRATVAANSEAWDNRTWGVLELTLKSGGYDWEFIPVAGQSFRDFGSGACIVAGPRTDHRQRRPVPRRSAPRRAYAGPRSACPARTSNPAATTASSHSRNGGQKYSGYG